MSLFLINVYNFFVKVKEEDDAAIVPIPDPVRSLDIPIRTQDLELVTKVQNLLKGESITSVSETSTFSQGVIRHGEFNNFIDNLCDEMGLSQGTSSALLTRSVETKKEFAKWQNLKTQSESLNLSESMMVAQDMEFSLELMTFKELKDGSIAFVRAGYTKKARLNEVSGFLSWLFGGSKSEMSKVLREFETNKDAFKAFLLVNLHSVLRQNVLPIGNISGEDIQVNLITSPST